MSPYTTSQGYYGSQQTSHTDEYTSSSNLDDGDKRRKRSSSSSKEKESVPNMHLVSLPSTSSKDAC